MFAGAALMLATLGAAACDSSSEPRTGAMTLLLTDAPGDVLAAVVTIDQIYLQSDVQADGACCEGRVVLVDEAFTTDLLTLQNTTQEIINGAVVPVGDYRQLRIVISGAYLEVEAEDGSSLIYASSPDYEGLPVDAVVAGNLQMPSFAQSGLKVNLPDGVVVINEDETVTLIIDFDVAQSFGQAAGNSGQWVMTPVLNAAPPPPTL
ncbi:MAG TPA: DUF4382 domain-containing protein [Gemmatimonadaceae bacterium]|nr:DUF4382 domain-containing protein [Gemmatimonadaceae bacterium]